MSVATLLTAAAVLVVGYRAGRAHAAWRDLKDAKKAVTAGRRTAWRHTVVLAMGAAATLVTILAAGYDLSR